MRRIILLTCVFFALLRPAAGYDHPGGMHPKKQIDFVKEKIRQQQQPYYAAYLQLIAEADSALLAPTHALADFNVPGYYVDAQTHRLNSKGLQTDAFNAYACALAYQLSGEKRYASKARDILMAWAHTNKGYSDADGPLVMAYSGTALIIAAELLYHHKGWKAKDKERFRSWAGQVYRKAAQQIRTKKNNWADWGRLGAILTAHLLDDKADMAENIRLVKSDLFHKIAADGHMPEEVRRGSNGIWYTYFSLAPITAACWVVLQAEGTNLFDYQQEGRSLQTALDYLLHYTGHPDQWKWFENPRPGSPASWPGNLFEAMQGIYKKEDYGAYAKQARPIVYPNHHFAWTFPTLMKPFISYDIVHGP
jgi:hypothetical protein